MNDLMILASITSSSQGDLTAWGAIFGIPTAIAVSFYLLTYRFYRNTDKNYNYEKETHVALSGLKTSDVKIGTNNGTQERYIKNRNSTDHRTRVKRIQLDVAHPETFSQPPAGLPAIPKPAPSQTPNPSEDIPDFIPPQNHV